METQEDSVESSQVLRQRLLDSQQEEEEEVPPRVNLEEEEEEELEDHQAWVLHVVDQTEVCISAIMRKEVQL